MKRAICILLLTLAYPAVAQQTQVTASVDSTTIGLNDSLQLTIRITGQDSTSAEIPYRPRHFGFRLAAGPSVSTQFQWINGRTSNTKSYTYTLLPEKEGDFTIDPISVTVGGNTYQTQSITIHVTAGTNRPPASRSRGIDTFGDELSRRTGDDLFVAAEIDRSFAYPGQQVTLYYHLYTQIGVTGLQLQESPALTGFWIEDIAVDSTPGGSRKVINGKEYVDYLVKKQALFPNGPGKFKIPPSTFAVSVRKDGDFFGFLGRTETIYRKTKELILEVKPLPAQGRPENFTGATGSFTITSSIDKAEAATGDAVTLRVKLAGRGNLKMIANVPVPAIPDLTVYSSKQTEDLRPNSKDAIESEKLWEYVLMPKAPGQQKVPPIVFSYFDPEQKTYETITTPALDIKVTPGAETGSIAGGLSGLNKQNLTRQATDIHYIKLSPEPKLQSTRPYQSPWFYLAAGIPVIFNLWAFLYQRERSRNAMDIVLVRNRRARQVAMARLKAAKKAGQSAPRRFYDEAAEALSGYLTNKFNLPEISMTSDIIEKSLTERAVPSPTLREIMSTMEECDFARFVSASAAPEKMKEIAARIEKLISTLERTS